MSCKNLAVLVLNLFCAKLLIGCAGPVSPFGGLEVWSGDGEFILFRGAAAASMELSVYPKRQVLHKPANFKIEINLTKQTKTQIERPQIKVTYNQKEVTHTFLKAAHTQDEPEKQFRYIFNRLNLRPDRHHQIDIYWRPDAGENFSHLAYLPPDCPMLTTRNITSTAPFNPKKEYIDSIISTANLLQLNPALLAGLIAQESGFDPTRLSQAKALGLTQITGAADEEIKKIRPAWLSDPRIAKLSVPELELLIQKGELSKRQDWRLDPILAIEGGALYLNFLNNYWNLSENKSLLNENSKTETTAVLLASYNSGAARVKNKIKSNREHWLDDKDLKEAFKYVNSVVSYCYHFSEE